MTNTAVSSAFSEVLMPLHPIQSQNYIPKSHRQMVPDSGWIYRDVRDVRGVRGVRGVIVWSWFSRTPW